MVALFDASLANSPFGRVSSSSVNLAAAAAVMVVVAVVVVSLGMLLRLQIVRFSCLLKRRNGRTYGRTDLRTDPLIEMRGRI